ncbi:hypothetical protein BDN72DRAFT_868491 [Pluteus cervinus]|uniref:Uncharacterized protein n=1 Tax=Pluteus cervinus TaxID=181527 RepID=A0ACD3BCZ4_9AGAR|nr:hypothetical protein BDN72DRAFT_868491 [Pluteus cervinus]
MVCLPVLVLPLVLLVFSGTTLAKNPKRGLAFAEGSNPSDIWTVNQTSSVLSWQYNWGCIPQSFLPTASMQYIPMQWGLDGIGSFASTVRSKNAKIILGFNEPDLGFQSNLDPTQAARLWKQYIQPLAAAGVKLGAPAISSGPNGRLWLYGDGLDAFYNYLWQMHSQFPGYRLWVTEFASTSQDPAAVSHFMRQSIRYMDNLNWIEAYAWFGFFREQNGTHYSLLDANGHLNELGKVYVFS